MMGAAEPFGGYGGPIRSYGRMYGSLDFDDVSRAALLHDLFSEVSMTPLIGM